MTLRIVCISGAIQPPTFDPIRIVCIAWIFGITMILMNAFAGNLKVREEIDFFSLTINFAIPQSLTIINSPTGASSVQDGSTSNLLYVRSLETTGNPNLYTRKQL